MKLEFEIGGRRASSNQLGRELTREISRQVDRVVDDHVRTLARRARCPRHGKTGRVIKRGGKAYVEGCCDELLRQLGR